MSLSSAYVMQWKQKSFLILQDMITEAESTFTEVQMEMKFWYVTGLFQSWDFLLFSAKFELEILYFCPVNMLF